MRCAFALAFVMSAAVHADEPSPLALAHVEEGQRAYDAGRYTEALDSFTAAYELAPSADMLVNMGQCHRQLKQHDKAIALFERYLHEQPDAQNKGEVEQLVEDEKRRERAETVIAPPPDPAPPVPAETADEPFVPRNVWIASGVGAAVFVVALSAAATVELLRQPPAHEASGTLGTYDLRGGT